QGDHGAQPEARRCRARGAPLSDATRSRSQGEGRRQLVLARTVHEEEVMSARFARFAALAESCDPEAAAEVRRVLAEVPGVDDNVLALAQAIGAAYPAL